MKWYQKSCWIYTLIIVFFPVGLYLLWKYSSWKKTAKVATTILVLLIAFLLLDNILGNISSETPTPQTSTIVVYITKTGSKYHRDGCRYLRSSKISVSLAEAKEAGYNPCSVCDPPQ